MKIVRLRSSNVMRLVAVDITPEGSLVTIGGRNDAGKTSVLSSIAMALGGAALCPVEPIRAGESEAEVRVDFDTDLVVTRKFKREKVDADGDHWTWSETTSTLTVANKAGAKYPSPQAVLDRLLGKLSFDPLAFKDDKDQAKTLRALVGLDTSGFERDRADAAAQRALLKKTLGIKQAQLFTLPKYDDAPAEETPLNTNKLREAEEYRKLAEEAEQKVSVVQNDISFIDRKREENRGSIASIEARMSELHEELKRKQDADAKFAEALAEGARILDAKKITAEAARAVVPDVMAISAEMAATEATNVKVRANKAHQLAEDEVKLIELQVVEQQTLVDAADSGKATALRLAKFPVPGLGLSDDGMTFGGLPFSQASSSEQLRVSVAIGLALNPTLKVLLVRNGNLLDDDHLKAMAEQADAAGAQIWMEYVTKDAADVQVMIEDGHVAS